MEESKQIPEEKNSTESSSEIKKESNKEENVKAFTEFLENASNQEIVDEKGKTDTSKELHYSCISQESFTYISNNKK